MGIGMSIFLIAAGAILRYAINVSIEGIELQTVGLILMIVGIIGLVISLAVMFMGGGDPRRPDDYPTRRL
jgi:Flp pilus assembly protein protease CpaA